MFFLTERILFDEEELKQTVYAATEELPIDVQHIIYELVLARCACGSCGGKPTYNRGIEVNDDGEPVLRSHFEIGPCACGKCDGEMCTRGNSTLNDEGKPVLRSHFEVGPCACGKCDGEMCTKRNSRLNDDGKPVLDAHFEVGACACPY